MKKTGYVFIYILAGLFLSGAILLSGCDSSRVAEEGDTVQVDYILTLSDGTLYQSSLDNEPLEFVIGQGQVLPDFDQAVIGMKAGESKQIVIPHERAYGEYREDFVITLNRNQLSDDSNPEVGDTLYTRDEAGNVLSMVVLEITDTTITVDANLPLAGQDLHFEIRLLKIS